MGSKKHKKHKSERKEREEKNNMLLERPPSLKLILKVSGNNSTPEHGNDSPAYGIQPEVSSASFSGEYSGERHKKSKKKKKKKDREKKHKHHKEKRRHRDDSSQEDFNSVGDESSQAPPEGSMFYAAPSIAGSVGSPASLPVTKPMIPMKSPEPEPMPIQQPATPATPATPMMLGNQEINAPSSVTTEEPMQSPVSMQSTSRPGSKMEFHDTNSSLAAPKTPGSDCSGREPRTCVLKLKQSRSPLARLLDHLLKALEKRDPHQFFAWPVTDDIAPGYSTIITKPMDFSTIRQKIDDNEYTSVTEFSDDFKLMCENAIRYNHSETVYHKAAKKLLHVGARLLQPENLMRSLRPLMLYMRELTSKELGFELPASADNQDNDHHTLDSADEAMAAAVDEGINAQINAQLEEEEKRKQIRLENNPTSKFEPFVDDLTPEEILQQVQSASFNARTKLLKKKSANKMGFLRHLKDGTTTMSILIDDVNNTPEKVVSLEAYTGKLQYGTALLQGFREDRRNFAKTVKPLNYGGFSSFAPIFDSRFSNLSKEESDLVLKTYGDETGADYAESIMKYTKDSPYAGGIAHSLLDILTNGEHRKTFSTLYESDMQRQETEAVKQTFPEPSEREEDCQKYANVPIDFNQLRSLSSLGVDMQFLDDLELQLSAANITNTLQQSLNANSDLIQKLHQIQTDRLSAPLPAHLSYVQRAGENEIELAAQITNNLTHIAKQLPPMAIAPPHGLRKAMGMSNVGLEIYQPPPVGIINPQPNPGATPGQHNDGNPPSNADIIDTTPMDMDLEPETITHHHHQHHQQHHHLNPNPSQVDIDSELRELLQNSSNADSVGGEPDPTAGIEHMLMG
ncbi:bromodomain-containing protein 7 [Toxorhynchites rutilus septentrionalis]|uniref:bromodomain-containing protein 7 n=1 Tax=Toxorhynchites rutilus septentrionalis TaxID=329112 RepID=UPI002479D827|nr:bromodomain-containing protein 7 [Toxorhynchites rutilus septentrionalis]